MFGRRRAPAHPASNHGSAASMAAQTAAASAFLKNATSSTSLSAAAAAAALRARPTTPTSVADVQTKRTMRRANSNSSVGSSAAGSLRGTPGTQLERRGSSGSMSERTLRSPSPNRNSAQPKLDSMPPVPAIPRNVAPGVPTNLHQRAASMETPITRITSPPPNLATGRGFSLESSRRNQTSRQPAQGFPSLAGVQELTGADRPSGRGSVNFSYPTGLREFSPYGQIRLTSPNRLSANQRLVSTQKQNLVYDPNTRSFLPESEILFYEQSIRDAADRPVKKKKKVPVEGIAGSHLADGTVGGRIRGTAVGTVGLPTGSTQQVRTTQHDSNPQSNAGRSKKKIKVVPNELNQEIGTYTPPASDYDSDNSDRSPRVGVRVGPLLAKRPSIVREEREQEEAEDETSKVLERQATLNKLEARTSVIRDVSPSPPPRSAGQRSHGKGALPALTLPQGRQQTHSVTQTAPILDPETITSAPEALENESNDSKIGHVHVPRVQSVSPVRTAHFLASPESLSVKHQPLGRSISPRKSALKHSPSSRGSSPNGDRPNPVGAQRGSSFSETSDTPTAASEERPLPRKKSVRVSFDDESNVVLGESDTTSEKGFAQAPTGKRGWFGSIGRGKKKDLASIDDDDDDEIMKPRPALPLFGSVREKKTRDAEERSLVRPTEPAVPDEALPSTLLTTTSGEAVQYSIGQSNDHVVGAIIAQDQAAKNALDALKSREPLPPEVTSVEGSGYVSDDSSSTSSIDDNDVSKKPVEGLIQDDLLKQRPEVDKAEVLETIVTQSPDIDHRVVPESSKPNGNGVIPALALTKATPTLEEIERKEEWLGMPGGFPQSSDFEEEDYEASLADHRPTDPTPFGLGIAEPEPIAHTVSSLTAKGIAAENQPSPPGGNGEESDESDGNSIYSDAAEDFSDMQGNGFMSLDAVLESPIVPTVHVANIPNPSESPSTRKMEESSGDRKAVSSDPSEPKTAEGWDKAQQYWTGLTDEKKKELEVAAQDDAENSLPGREVKPLPKPKSQKAAIASPSPLPQSTPSNVPQVGSRYDRSYQIRPGAKALPDSVLPAMRSSMRAAAPVADDAGHMRKSMRSGGSVKGSLRNSSDVAPPPLQSKAASPKKQLPVSAQRPKINSGPTDANKQPKSISAGAVSTTSANRNQVTPRPTPTLRRKGSAESDSSFKRTRPVTEGVNMRKSLRGPPPKQTQGRPQSPEASAPVPRTSRFSLRSLSPSGSSFRAGPPVTMPQTMRHTRKFSDDSNTPTLRSSASERTKSSLKFPGFGRSKPSPRAKAALTRASRFADSSDEEDVLPSFRSRFDDSSDEEDAPVPTRVAKNRPRGVRGVRQFANAANEDSSDLPDSDDEKTSQFLPPKTATDLTVSAATAKLPAKGDQASASDPLRRSGSGRGFMAPNTTTTISSSTSTKQRSGSFMSILRRKKPDPSSKVRKLDLESAARRDTPLERSRADLAAVKRQDFNRQDSNFSTASGSSNTKLQKRVAPAQAVISENWPLTSPRPETNGVENAEGKPNPSSGKDADVKMNGGENGGDTISGRPELGARRSTGVAQVDLSSVTTPKRKKKFGILRRAFRLDD